MGAGVVRPLPPAPPPVLASNVKIKVAILLPLSGKNAPLGQAMLNAAQQAVFDVADQHFELIPRDTGSTEGEAEAAARDALASGAQLFIGPVFADAVNRVKPVANLSGINMLTLSSDATLADQNVFVMGFAPGAQVERVIAFAHARGVHNFAALIPKNAYGDLVGEIFRAEVARAGDQIADYETYDPARHDSETAVNALAAHKDEIGALFLPEGGSDLTLIAGQLKTAGFDHKRVHLIGTGLWDTPDTGRADFLGGAWYAAPDPRARQNFLKAYLKTYGQPPPRLATLAYDATALAALLAKQGGHFDRVALTNPSGFAGIDGIFRLTQAGIVERGLAVLEVNAGAGRVVDPAPTTFAGAGF
jgi:branched-chain amino acid transport system substrate-binding protein